MANAAEIIRQVKEYADKNPQNRAEVATEILLMFLSPTKFLKLQKLKDISLLLKGNKLDELAELVKAGKYGDEVERIIQKAGGKEKFLSLVQKHGDEVLDLAAKYGDDAVKVVKKFGEKGLKAIKNMERAGYSEKEIKMLRELAEAKKIKNGEEIIKEISNPRNKDNMKGFINEAREGVKYAKKGWFVEFGTDAFKTKYGQKVDLILTKGKEVKFIEVKSKYNESIYGMFRQMESTDKAAEKYAKINGVEKPAVELHIVERPEAVKTLERMAHEMIKFRKGLDEGGLKNVKIEIGGKEETLETLQKLQQELGKKNLPVAKTSDGNKIEKISNKKVDVKKSTNKNQQKQNPILKKQNPKPKKDNPALKMDNPTLEKDNPVLKKDNPILRMQNPVLKLDNPILKKENPTLRMDNPTLKTQNPTLKTGRRK